MSKYERKRLLSDLYDLSKARACNAATEHFVRKYGCEKHTVRIQI